MQTITELEAEPSASVNFRMWDAIICSFSRIFSRRSNAYRHHRIEQPSIAIIEVDFTYVFDSFENFTLRSDSVKKHKPESVWAQTIDFDDFSGREVFTNPLFQEEPEPEQESKAIVQVWPS